MNKSSQRLLVLLAGVALAAAGCGTSSETASEPSASPSVEQHAAQTGEPELVQVDGYEYSNLEGPDMEEALAAYQSEFDSINAETPGSISAWSIHQVDGPEGVEMGLLQIQVGAELAADPANLEGIVAALVGGLASEGASVEYETVAGVEVGKAVMDDSAIMAWPDGAQVFIIFADSEDDARTFAEALITA